MDKEFESRSSCLWIFFKTRYQKLVFETKTAICKSSVIRQKDESQNGCFRKTKHVKFSEKRTFFYPMIRTCTCAYQGVKNVRFSENLTCFAFLKHPFWDSPFCLIIDEMFFKVGVLKSFLTFTWRLWNRWFPVMFAKFLRTPFLKEHLRWPLLKVQNLSSFECKLS